MAFSQAAPYVTFLALTNSVLSAFESGDLAAALEIAKTLSSISLMQAFPLRN
jgi:hypothetical protein